MTAFTTPQIGDKVRNIYTGREFVVRTIEVVDFGQGDGPEVCVSVKGDRGEDDVWSGKVTAFEPVDAEATEAPAAHDARPCEDAGEHRAAARHTRAECPTTRPQASTIPAHELWTGSATTERAAFDEYDRYHSQDPRNA